MPGNSANQHMFLFCTPLCDNRGNMLPNFVQFSKITILGTILDFVTLSLYY